MSRRRKMKAEEKAAKESGHAPQGGGGRLLDRRAAAHCTVKMHPSTLERVLEKAGTQAHVLEAARAAGLVAARNASNIVPSRRSQNVAHVRLDFAPAGNDRMGITAEVRHSATDDVDTEALAAVAAAALTIYEMCRNADQDIILADMRVLEKGSEG